MNLNQESDMFLAGFQNCYKTVAIMCLSFNLFSKGSSIADILALSHYTLSECEGRYYVSLSQRFFRSKGMILREL